MVVFFQDMDESWVFPVEITSRGAEHAAAVDDGALEVASSNESWLGC